MSVFRILVMVSLLAVVAQADFFRAELGVGMINAEPGGTFSNKDGSNESELKEDLKLKAENNLYAWAFFQHPVPFVPNVRLEYLALNHSSDDTKAEIKISELDGILYYNVFDILMTSVDLGVDVKNIQADFGNKNESATIGLLFGRARLEPGDFGLELMLKATNYGETKGYDARIKADYTLSIIPIIHPALEVGYRFHKIQYEIGSSLNKAEYTGVYGGLMLRF